MQKIKWGVFLVVAFAVALPAGVAYAQHDHFKTYLTTGGSLPAPFDVSLTDQFGTVQGVVEQLIMFSNPVEKNYEPIVNTDNHLTWYDFPGATAQQQILVTNQFGIDQEWVVQDTAFLLVPAWKFYLDGMPTGHGPPSGLDHYLCYNVVSGPSIGVPVHLVDQFFNPTLDVDVLDPVVFCNPVEKTILPGGPTYDIIDPDNHLACYDIDPKIPPMNFFMLTIDQFYDFIFDPLDSQFLCVPSTKKIKPGGCFASVAEGVE